MYISRAEALPPFAKLEPHNHMESFPTIAPSNDRAQSPHSTNGGARVVENGEENGNSNTTGIHTSEESADDAEKSSFNCGESKLEIVESPVRGTEARQEQQPSPVQARVSFTMLHDKAVSD